MQVNGYELNPNRREKNFFLYLIYKILKRYKTVFIGLFEQLKKFVPNLPNFTHMVSN